MLHNSSKHSQWFLKNVPDNSGPGKKFGRFMHTSVFAPTR